jgi:cytochrome c biogenesis protein CcdA
MMNIAPVAILLLAFISFRSLSKINHSLARSIVIGFTFGLVTTSCMLLVRLLIR